MNHESEQRLKTLFPRSSRSFLDANSGLRSETDKSTARTALVGAASGKEKSDERIVLSYVIYRVRLLDPDALDQSTKTITDCLCEVGLILGDSAKDIELAVRQEKVNHYIEQRTTVDIQYP